MTIKRKARKRKAGRRGAKKSQRALRPLAASLLEQVAELENRPNTALVKKVEAHLRAAFALRKARSLSWYRQHSARKSRLSFLSFPFDETDLSLVMILPSLIPSGGSMTGTDLEISYLLRVAASYANRRNDTAAVNRIARVREAYAKRQLESWSEEDTAGDDLDLTAYGAICQAFRLKTPDKKTIRQAFALKRRFGKKGEDDDRNWRKKLDQCGVIWERGCGGRPRLGTSRAA